MYLKIPKIKPARYAQHYEASLFCYIILVCITCLVCSAEDKPESFGPVEEEKSSEHQPENQTEKPGPLEPATTLSDLADKTDNEQDVSAMEVE